MSGVAFSINGHACLLALGLLLLVLSHKYGMISLAKCSLLRKVVYALGFEIAI